MKLATLKNGRRDGALVVVSQDNTQAVFALDIAPTLQYALDNWEEASLLLQQKYQNLNAGKETEAFPFEAEEAASPLPRSYAWLDGSAYINHVVLVRKARSAEPPATLKTDPLMYQGGSDAFLGPRDDIELADESWGCDFESEVAVVTGDVPQGVSPKEAEQYVKLVLLCNDVSLRNLIPGELAKGFGFFQSKPSSAFSPIAVTPDELGDAWQNGRVHLPLHTHLNGNLFGQPEAGPEMHFNFYELISHAAKSRPLSAGTIIGSGTVSNEDTSKGSSCLAEKRMLEKINTGVFRTPFLKYGDQVTIEMFQEGHSVFGQIAQKVTPYQKPLQENHYGTHAS
ncbi:MAG: 2-keto-4-pentenoate hydratase [Myxococcales bacterium]|nr:2-keto-4-pentenoate hydratase [Myxococcales bacterium]|tara:strand:- start:3536 stop:4555 length:1020 start_codon:yes stop_codon:yes gene_type:complete